MNVFVMVVMLVKAAKWWIIATGRIVLIMASVTTFAVHTNVHVIQDILELIVNTRIVPIMCVRMVQRV